MVDVFKQIKQWIYKWRWFFVISCLIDLVLAYFIYIGVINVFN